MTTSVRPYAFLLLLVCSARAAPLLSKRDGSALSGGAIAVRHSQPYRVLPSSPLLIKGIAVGVASAGILTIALMGWLVYYKRFRARTRSTSTRPADANTSTWSLSALLSTRPPTHNSSTPAVRELTAEQLMGTQPTTTNSGPPPAAANRRNRRPRRTPSQMSTTSLPAYNKEPGEQEVVVYRWVAPSIVRAFSAS